jgi:hypothetical protein
MMALTSATDQDRIWKVMNRNTFFVKNAVKKSELKTSDKFDLHDPDSKELLVEIREPNLGMLTRVARAFGGEHDQGVSFDMVATIPGSQQQLFRIKRGGTSFSFGGVPMQFLDHNNGLIGRMKKETFALGLKFTFTNEQKEKVFVLEAKTKLLSIDCELWIAGRSVAWLKKKPDVEQQEYFKEGNFSHVIKLAPELPPQNPVRQLLLAFGTAIHRVNA